MISQKVALYARVSSAEQADGYSIAGQLGLLRTYCDQKGLSIYKDYVDAGISGKSLEGRQAALELLADARQGQFNIVLVWKVSRLARNLSDLLQVVSMLDQNGVSLISLSERFDTSTATGKLTLQALGAVAELERKQIGQNVSLGKRQRARQGKYTGPSVLGYDLVTDSLGKTLTLQVNDSEAQLVQDIFKVYSSGKGLKAIVNRINSSGHTTKNGKLFSISFVSQILRNQLYIGMINYASQDSAGQRIRAVAHGLHEPIISKELWDLVQARRDSKRTRSLRTVKRAYPLVTLLRCPACDSGMIPAHAVSRSRKGLKIYHYYSCSRHLNLGRQGCMPNLVKAETIESVVLGEIFALLENPKLIDDITNEINIRQRGDDKRREAQNREIASIEKARSKALDDYEGDKLAKDEALALLSSYKNRISAIRHEMGQDSTSSATKLKRGTVKVLLSKMLRKLKHSQHGELRRLLRLVIKAIRLPREWQELGPEIEFKLDFITGLKEGELEHWN